jgi:hypothetical protein
MATESSAQTSKKSRKPRANSKSEAVRAYLKRKPNAGPTEIAKALKKKGINISPAHVSNVKAALRKQGEGSGANGRSAGANGRAGRRGRRASGDAVSLGSLLAARRFAESVGGVDRAAELLDALTKLQK